MGKDVIVALDFPTGKEALDFLDLFQKEERKPYVKVGMELFYSEGPEIVRQIKKRGHSIFLDLKLHDIPNTVKGGMASLKALGVDMTNVHASGGILMMKAGLEGLSGGEHLPILIAVTQLTSTDQRMMEEELLIPKTVKEVVLHYGENAKAAGLSGKALSMVGSFQDMLESWKDVELTSLIDRILQDTEYEKDLQAEGAIEAESRMENIQELQGKLQSYIEENGDEGSLSAFLEEVSLLSDLDRSDLTEDKITLMTLHGAKGLEFPVVYLVGLNEGLFPSAQSMFTPEEREEERRLFYVGITRAEKELYLTAGRDRVVHGQYQSMLVSSFVDDVPEEYLEKKYLYRKKPSEEDIFMEKTGRSGYSSYLQQANQSIKAYMGQSGYGDSASSGYGRRSSYGSTGAYGSSGRSSSTLYGSTGYSSSKKPLDLQAYQQAGIIQKGISGMSSGSLDYQVGDRVSHTKFGEGEVLAIEEDKKDKLVTVLFDTAGQKKMLAGFAKLKKL